MTAARLEPVRSGRRKILPAAILLAALACVPAWPVTANFVYDLSSRLIALTTAFAGTQVLLYGAAAQSAGAIAVTVRGPADDVTVRRKSRVGPIWINTSAIRFRDVPSFYAVATSMPLEQLAGPATLARYELGPDRLHLNPVVPDAFEEEEVAEFRAALLRNQQRRGLFSTEPGTVSFLGDVLFRTRIVFPANVPPGDYQVQVLQFADGEVVAAQSSKLEVGKIGVEAELYEFAMGQPALYGAVALLLALGSGWLANAMFRRP
ncbi:MAG: TIGR02186 family protein [Geminicoccaceae bacterium]